ncbi:BadF/BadG/BcrA/BcrD ATPase family protein [Kineococcus sp. SYSU DK005]|uniref:BadF/BadG/BcrA/BcrD ATPase family protein n=1 Tax=Kineococcus sp. SYSU DK005 TaxID=3383126 RepID=UPI003D7D4E06
MVERAGRDPGPAGDRLPAGPLLVGLDVGGSGARALLTGAGGGGAGLRVGGPGTAARGDGVLRAVRAVLGDLAARRERDPLLRGRPVAALALGAAGLASVAADRDAVRAEVVAALAPGAVVLAADALTAHAGALGDRPGAVVAAGTGVIGLGRSAAGTWTRVDGWGHLLGDRGGAAWIGRRALEEALRAQDGRCPAGHRLLAAARAALGEPRGWPRLLAGDDRARVLASLAPAVTALAGDGPAGGPADVPGGGPGGDPAARAVVAQAGSALAETAVAAARAAGTDAVAWTGGAFASAALLASFRTALAATAPDLRALAPAGSPLDGALALARAAAAGPLSPVPGLLWT